MRLVAIFSLVLFSIACGRPVSDAPPEPLAPIAHLAGTIGPVDEIDTDATATVYDDGEYLSATLNGEHGGIAVMARLNAVDARVITVPMHEVFVRGNGKGVSAVGCAGSAEGRWDIIDAPAEVILVDIDDDGLVTVELLLRDHTETVTGSFSLVR